MTTQRNAPGQGRKRQPPELKILHGTFRSDRHGDADVIKAVGEGGRPKCPPHLVAYDPLCAQYWETLCDLMEEVGVPFAGTDVPLELFVRSYADLRKDMQHPAAHAAALHRNVKKVIKEPGGKESVVEWAELRRNPVRVEMRQISQELHKLACDLGLTSSGRARLLAELGVPSHDRLGVKPAPIVETRFRG